MIEIGEDYKMEKVYTLADLKSGMAVVFTNGRTCIVTELRGALYINTGCSWTGVSDYNQDLSHRNDSSYDIVRVYGFDYPYLICMAMQDNNKDITDCASWSGGALILYDKEENECKYKRVDIKDLEIGCAYYVVGEQGSNSQGSVCQLIDDLIDGKKSHAHRFVYCGKNTVTGEVYFNVTKIGLGTISHVEENDTFSFNADQSAWRFFK